MRVPLNPCDYHFYTLQRDATDALTCRFRSTMGFDVAGAIGSDDLKARMNGVIGALPVLAGRLRFSPILARPQWQIDNTEGAIDDVYRFEDLSNEPNALASADLAVDQAASGPIDLSRAPLVRLHHIRTSEFDRVLLIWPHSLTDGQGAYEVLRRLASAGDPSHIKDSENAASQPSAIQHAWPTRISNAIRGYRAQREVSGIQTQPPLTGPLDSAGRARFARRLGAEGSFAPIAAAAKRLSPPGPGLYARHLAACTIRALRRLYDKRGWTTPAYAISFPMRPGGISPAASLLGNYLVAAALHVLHDIALDWPRLGAAIATQVKSFTAKGGDRDQWALLWASSLMRPRQYHSLMKSSVARTPLISGYSYFQAGDENPVEQFAGHPIRGCLFGGVATIPPGWNPAFWRHGTRLTMTLAWPVGFIADDLAIEFADLIESEALGST